MAVKGDAMTQTRPNVVRVPRRCPECGCRDVSPCKTSYSARVGYDGKQVLVEVADVEAFECVACKQKLFDGRVDDAVNRELRRSQGLLQPEEIRSWRERLGVTQSELAGWLLEGRSQGLFASESVSRWENGVAIQSAAMDYCLRSVLSDIERRKVAGTSVAGVTSLAPVSTAVQARRRELDEQPAATFRDYALAA